MDQYAINEVNLIVPLEPIYGGTGINTYNTGDMLYATSSSTLAKLPIGATGQVLTSTGSLPTWSDFPKGATGATGATGDTGPSIPINKPYLYSVLTAAQSVNNNRSVVFNNPPDLYDSTNYSYTIAAAAPAGNAYFTVLSTGTYLISYILTQNTTDRDLSYCITINGVADGNYITSTGSKDIFGITYVTNLNSGDELRLVNFSGVTVNHALNTANSVVSAIVLVKL